MKITKSQLKQIIKEELSKVFKENTDPEVGDAVDKLEMAGALDLAEEGFNAEQTIAKLRSDQRAGKSWGIPLANFSDETLMTALNMLLGLPPRPVDNLGGMADL